MHCANLIYSFDSVANIEKLFYAVPSQKKKGKEVEKKKKRKKPVKLKKIPHG